MKSVWAGAALAVVTACVGVEASAATITRSYSFEATNFKPAAPIDDVIGSLTVTFDPSLPSQGPFSLDAFTFNLGAGYDPVVFTAGPDHAFIGNDCFFGECQVLAGTQQFYFAFGFDKHGGVTDAGPFVYSVEGGSATYLSFDVTVTALAVPLPPGAPLFGTALVALGVTGYGLKRRSHSRAA